MGGGDEREARRDFGMHYGSHAGDLYAAMEQAVIGGDWGVNGYTTVKEADELGRVLRLGPGVRLVDIGSGRGWPGLYLSAATGCDVIATDLPVEGLLAGRRRAARTPSSGQSGLVVASAGAPPFRVGSFDAVVHTDVLC